MPTAGALWLCGSVFDNSSRRLVLVLVIVIVIAFGTADYEHEHDYDYGGEAGADVGGVGGVTG